MQPFLKEPRHAPVVELIPVIAVVWLVKVVFAD